jgi:hypothetical protein
LNDLSGRPIYDALARIVFVTPGFLSFVRAVFPPVLCLILTLSSPPSLELLISGIKSNWGANLGLLPSVIIQLLSGATDPPATLARAFVDIALDSNHAIVYGLIDFNQTLRRVLTSVLRSLLSVGELTILDDLVHMATHSVRHMAPVLTLVLFWAAFAVVCSLIYMFFYCQIIAPTSLMTICDQPAALCFSMQSVISIFLGPAKR